MRDKDEIRAILTRAVGTYQLPALMRWGGAVLFFVWFGVGIGLLVGFAIHQALPDRWNIVGWLVTALIALLAFAAVWNDGWQTLHI